VPAQLALLCALWALRKARFELANAVLLVTATLAISVLVWQNSGLRDPAMIAYPAILAFASTMGGRRLFVFLLAMILLVVALVGVANLQGWHVNAVPTHTLGSMINVSIVLSLTAFLIWLMAGDLRTALANVTAENERVRRSQARIEFLATHDSLTGLPNRILARDRFGHAIALARRHQTSITSRASTIRLVTPGETSCCVGSASGSPRAFAIATRSAVKAATSS
jgi:predicted signal transduction protein with EAL and GGDEF domain